MPDIAVRRKREERGERERGGKSYFCALSSNFLNPQSF